MKKRFAIIFAIASACAFDLAHAQSLITLYGVIDNGIEYQNGGAGPVVRAASSGLFATVYGLKGREDIGGGLHVNFQLEQGFSGVTGAASDPAAAFNRLAWIGLSGKFGEIRFGRQKKPQYLFLNDDMDPTGVKSFASPLNNFNDVSVRANNAIVYVMPTVYGLAGQFMVAMRDQSTQPSNGVRVYNAALRYTNGPFRMVAGYEQSGSADGTSTQRAIRAAGSYKIGNAQLYAAYQSERQTDNSDKLDVYEVSGSYLLNPFNMVSVMYGYAHDRTGQGNNAQQIGLMYAYFVSKTTILYAAAALIQNRNQADYTLNGTQYSGIAVAPGAYARGVIVGMTHKF
ncbi:porin [Trinickia caryophylli]|uniref:Outer membrane protein (Porin) n=1 Tax=Trinickia caryophylli TaxID=28094 RepID=A0A1X7EA40_TRICW|nr:porin [Trinickia caryophylli]PMS12993.1 porin [Trinickia caryophylli]TRX14753.1 porin [Trinickia caryophylli]WQE14600.1 porin [Trinickia caryophylli]SMF30190.1 Outer membrane protein (porin) [Trinickia caryophylli]GLU31985.1 porin [Trinickia caryophylli]